MKIRDINPDQVVKIGTEKGSGYFYVGRLGDADLDALNEQLLSDFQKSLDNALEREQKAINDYKTNTDALNGARKKYDEARKLVDMFVSMAGPDAEGTMKARSEAFKISEEIKKYETLSECAAGEREKAHEAVKRNRKKIDAMVPLKEREVVDTYDSINEKGVLCVIVEGLGEGKLWAINEDKPFEINYLQGVIEVYGAALRIDTNVLEREYEMLYRQRNTEKTRNNIISVLASEQAVVRSALGIVKDTNGLVRMCRLNAVNLLSHNAKGELVKDPKEVHKTILRLLGRDDDEGNDNGYRKPQNERSAAGESIPVV